MHNARAVAASANAELVVCYDAVADLSHAAAAELGCATATTLEEALDAHRVDAAFVSVPHDLHEPLAVAAAQSGLHVVIEKPLAADLSGARAAVEATVKAGVVLSVCFPFRYEAAVVAAHRLVRAGALGKLRGATVVFHADKPASYWAGGFSGRSTSDWRSRRARAGGGVLIMNLTHYVDFIRHIADAEFESVMAVARTDAGAEVEDAIVLTLDFGGGAIGTILGSASTRGNPPNRFELWGDAGTLRLEPEALIYTERAIDGLASGRWCALPVEPAVDPREVFVTRFAAAVLEGRLPDVTAADGLAVQTVVEAAYRSVEQGSAVSLRALAGVPA
jgi:predicted dehydrogenase